MTIPLSVIIIAKNEERQIGECIQSVYGWVDEIIVVDDESFDRTVDIAKRFTNHVFIQKMELEGKQRNFGASQARNNWVMMLDCDERVTPELKTEIIEIMTGEDPGVTSYWMKQICYLGKAQLKYGGWESEHVRIYHKDRFRWKEDPYDLVHPGFEENKKQYRGGIILKNKLLHYNFANIEDFIRKTNAYTTKEAVKAFISGKKMSFGRSTWRMIDRFFRRYIGKKGYKDGFYGFIAAAFSGFYELLSYSKYREIQDSGAYLDQFKHRLTGVGS